MAATNEQVIDRIDKFEGNVNERFDKQNERIAEVDRESKERDEDVCGDIERIDAALRGNGTPGLKAQVAENTKKLEKIDKYFFTIVMFLLGDFFANLFGVI